MSVESLFEVFVHNVAFLGTSQQVVRPVCHIILAEYEPLYITSRLSLASLRASAQVVSIAAGKSCTFLSSPPTPEHGSTEVACTITPNSGTSAHGDIIGGALLRLPAQQAQCGKLCPIWLHRAQVLPLRSSDTGAQTALMCISLRLVQLTQECPRVRPEPAASPSPASSQASFSSDSRSASLDSRLSPLPARGVSTPPHIASLHLASEAWQQMRPQSPNSAETCSRPDTAQHANLFGRRTACASRPGKCALAEDAGEHATPCLTGKAHASSSGRSKGPIKGGSCKGMDHFEADMGLLGGPLSDSHVIMSKEILRDLMADLAQGLADITKLKQEATSARAPLAPCKKPSTLKPHPDRLPASSPMTPDNDPPQQCSSQGLQKAGTQASQPPLQPGHARANSRDGHSRRGQQRPGRAQTWQSATSSKPEAQQPNRGPQEHSYAQPTGHPMILWQGALRSERPLGSRPQRTCPVPHAVHVGKHGTGLHTSRAGALESKESTKTQEDDVHLSQTKSAHTAQHAPPQSSGAEDRNSEQQRDAEQPATEQPHEVCTALQAELVAKSSTAQAAPWPGKEEHTNPAMSPSLCHHLKQRYLPVYSVFDERGNLACDVVGQDNATCSLGSHEATLNGLTSPCSARQHAQPQDNHGQPSYGSSAAGKPTQSVHIDADSAGPEVQALKHQHAGEDKLRAALHAFAAKVGGGAGVIQGAD